MRRSTDRILTTHAGSLPNLSEPPPSDPQDVSAAVKEVVARQREVGLDLVNEGEYTKGGDWLSFADFYRYALAEALREEYELIAESGLVLQVDDAWLPALWDRIAIEMGLEAFRERCRIRVQALNHALRNIPEGRICYHLCWGSWHGPHAYDIELARLVDILPDRLGQARLAGPGRPAGVPRAWHDARR